MNYPQNRKIVQVIGAALVAKGDNGSAALWHERKMQAVEKKRVHVLIEVI